MSRALPHYSDLVKRIDRWNHEVIRNTLQPAPTIQPRPGAYQPHCMRLRSQATRPALAEVSVNPNTRKRKTPGGMADTDASKPKKKSKMGKNVQGATLPKDSGTLEAEACETIQQYKPLRRGRSQQDVELQKCREREVVMRSEVPALPGPASSSASPRKAAKSPSKRGRVAVETPTPDAAIDMEYLSRCTPAVNLTTFSDLAIDGETVTLSVRELHQKLKNVPRDLIPSTLQVNPSSCL